MYCPYCGKEINEGSEFCSICNSNLKRIKESSEFSCEKCKASTPEDAKFCFNCGDKFEEIPKDMNDGRSFNEKSFKKETSNQYEQSEGGYWSFDKMVSGSLIKVLYVLGALAITIFSVIMLINGSQARYGGSTVILLALVYLVLGNLFWRIVCEGIIIIFKIFEKLNQIELKIK